MIEPMGTASLLGDELMLPETHPPRGGGARWRATTIAIRYAG